MGRVAGGTAALRPVLQGGGELVGWELVRALVPLREPWVSAAGSFSGRDSLLVRAVLRYASDAGGRAESEGWGECTALPEPSYSSEYTSGAVEVSEAYLLPALLAAKVASAGDVAPALAGVKGHKMAKSAFEAALLDAELRAAGVRMADFLASLSSAGKPAQDAVAAGVAVGLQSSLAKLLDEVERYVGEGYLRVKLKIAPGWDDGPLGELRRRWPDLVLFADANGAYADMGPLEAAARLVRMDDYELACLEQPLGDDDLAGHRDLARQLRTPLCLDESLTSVASVRAALEMGACSVVNVKAGRFGGYVEAVRVHDLCAERSVPVWCGGMVETGIGRAGNVALASLPNFTLPGDLSASGRFFAQDLAGPLDLGAGGTISVPAGPGTGVTVSAEALRAFVTWRRWYPAS
jgi:O-succinylbenzoate synthase